MREFKATGRTLHCEPSGDGLTVHLIGGGTMRLDVGQRRTLTEWLDDLEGPFRG